MADVRVGDERVEVPGSHRPVPTNALVVGSPDPGAMIDVTVTLRAPSLPTADDSGAPGITADRFAAEYAADQSDAETVTTALQQFGLRVTNVSLPTASIGVRGTVAQMDAAFGVQLRQYQSAGQGEFRGRAGDIRVPAALEGIVTGVFGLDERQVARRRTTTSATRPAPASASATTHRAAVTPADLESRYGFPAGDAAGQRVVIVEFGGAYFENDLHAFCAKYQRAVPVVTPVSVGGPVWTVAEIEQQPHDKQAEIVDISVEVMMDVEIIASLCPAAQISVYFAEFTQKGWIDVINAVIGAAPDLPVAVSISWGLAEDSSDWSHSALRQIERRLHAAALLGVTICVSTGDDGAGDQIFDGQAHVNFPASSPHVLAVGGTQLDAPDGAEVMWWESPGDRAHHGGSTGGGVSGFFPRPAWQRVHVAPLGGGGFDGRVLPDVAALAGEPFYDLIFLGHDSPNGGTSAAAPLWAALLARVAPALPATHRRRFLTTLLYRAHDGQAGGAVVCNDVAGGPDGVEDNRSTGRSPGYPVGAGYDAVTGWGTPNGANLVDYLSAVSPSSRSHAG